METLERRNEVEWVREIIANPERFEELHRQYHRLLRAFIYRILNDRCAVDDVLQNAWINIHRSLPDWRSISPLKSWILTIARHQCYRYWHSHTFGEQPGAEAGDSTLELTDPSPDPEQVCLNREKLRSLAKAIRQLPRQQRLVALLILLGFQQQDISRVLGGRGDGATAQVAREKLMGIYRSPALLAKEKSPSSSM